MTTPKTIQQLDTSDAILRLVELKEMEARIKDEKDLLNAQLIKDLGQGTHKHDHATVTISRRGTVDKTRLAADYPYEKYPTLYEQTISTAGMKNQFAPAALEEYKTYSAPSVTIR